jgi:hypothetical protein
MVIFKKKKLFLPFEVVIERWIILNFLNVIKYLKGDDLSEDSGSLTSCHTYAATLSSSLCSSWPLSQRDPASNPEKPGL